MLNFNKEEILLSVIVPIYGVEDFLEECIESIINQSYRNLQIILVDDGSKGKEAQICDKYAKIDSRIVVIHKKNEGIIKARKTGVELSKGEFVTFVDGDDFIASDYYSRMMKIVYEENPDMVAVAFRRWSNNVATEISQCVTDGIYEGEKLRDLWSNMNCYKEKYYNHGLFPSTWSKLYRKNIISNIVENVPQGIKLGEDAAITFPCLLNSKKVVVDNTITGYYYRILSESMSNIADETLFTGTSLLYNFLKPYYINNRKQLEYYRAYLIEIAISRWEGQIRLATIHKECKKIRKYVNECEILSDLEELLSLDISKKMYKKLVKISKSQWLGYEIQWIIERALLYFN